MSTTNIQNWFKADDFTEVEDINIHPNVSVFNRKLYTFGNKKETYLKFSSINSNIKSQDEISYLDTRSCLDFKKLFELASLRVENYFDKFMKDIQNN